MYFMILKMFQNINYNKPVFFKLVFTDIFKLFY